MITDHSVSTLVKDSTEESSEAYKIELLAAIKEAQAEIAQGDFITHEELQKEFSSWVTK